MRDSLHLEAEALAQLRAAVEQTDRPSEEGQATQQAHLNYAAERTRLLYVGITRARPDLIITWNSGKRGDQQPAVPFTALCTSWEHNR